MQNILCNNLLMQNKFQNILYNNLLKQKKFVKILLSYVLKIHLSYDLYQSIFVLFFVLMYKNI